MTCREFKHRAASLTLWELSGARDEAILGHSEACESCSGWLQKQRALAGSMQTLQARTSAFEASPDVERALLRAFRQATPASTGVTERSQPAAVLRSTPIALRLSRFFEIGAYVAVAAAIVVGVFLGVRLLQPQPHPQAAGQRQAVEAVVTPPAEKAATSSASQVAGSQVAAVRTSPIQTNEALGKSSDRVREPSSHRSTGAIVDSPRVLAEESQASADAGYVPLMFCDPLSCAADSQVVRMELPAQNDAQPQLADVVVGLDGVVRAVRIVN